MLVKVSNISREPVSQAEIAVDNGRPRSIGTIPPDHPVYVELMVQYESTPQSEARQEARIRANEWSAHLDFTDAGGERWRRHADGILDPL